MLIPVETIELFFTGFLMVLLRLQFACLVLVVGVP